MRGQQHGELVSAGVDPGSWHGRLGILQDFTTMPDVVMNPEAVPACHPFPLLIAVCAFR
jgi:hypothetical protein